MIGVFFKLTLLAASIALARSNACAAPCMVARQRSDVATTGIAIVDVAGLCRATDLGAAVPRPDPWRGRAE